MASPFDDLLIFEPSILNDLMEIDAADPESHEFLREVIEDYLVNSQKISDQLIISIEHKNFAEVQRLSHSVKSNANTFGLSRLAKSSLNAEQLAKKSEPADEAVKWVVDHIAESHVALREFLAGFSDGR